VTDHRYSRSGASLAFATLLLGSAFLLIPITAGFAAPAASHKARVAAADLAKSAEAEEPATTASAKAATEEDDAGCYRARRKLWVDGEGWIVRRVTLCR
jgi:hypothetical protein